MIEADRIRDVADEVLSRPEYRDLTPAPVTRLLAEIRSRVAEWLFDLFTGTAAGRVGLLIAIAVVVLVVGLGIVAVVGLRRRSPADLVVDDVTGLTPEQAVAEADRARAAGDLHAAVRARYAAIVLELVDRDVLASVPGVTVGEVTSAVAGAAPTAVDAVDAAGRALADVVYGHREATAAADDTVALGLATVRRAVARRAVAV